MIGFIFYINYYNNIELWLPRSQIKDIVSLSEKYQENTNKLIALIQKTESMDYYLNKANIKYQEYESLEELVSQDINQFDFIILITLKLTSILSLSIFFFNIRLVLLCDPYHTTISPYKRSFY